MLVLMTLPDVAFIRALLQKPESFCYRQSLLWASGLLAAQTHSFHDAAFPAIREQEYQMIKLHFSLGDCQQSRSYICLE